MKKLRILVLILIVAAIVAAAFIWSRQAASGYVSPSACVNAFYNALLDMDTQRLGRCSVPEFHEQAKQLALEKKNISSWIEKGPAKFEGATAYLNVEETRPGSDQAPCVRFRLQKVAGGWLIAGVREEKGTKMNVFSGTSVDSVPNP